MAAAIAVTLPARADDAIESCVSATSIEFHADDRRVLLQPDDALHVFEAVVQRYPVLQRDGLVPSHMLLWRKPAGELLYVTLMVNPERPAELCFTATITAAPFDFTAPLMKKYLSLETI